MKTNYRGVLDLAERIEEVYAEIESETGVYLRENDDEFSSLWKEHLELQKKFPVIAKLTQPIDEVYSAMHISIEEHKALVKYLGMKQEMERMEKQQLYYRGHTDSYAYLVKIVGIHID